MHAETANVRSVPKVASLQIWTPDMHYCNMFDNFNNYAPYEPSSRSLPRQTMDFGNFHHFVVCEN